MFYISGIVLIHCRFYVVFDQPIHYHGTSFVTEIPIYNSRTGKDSRPSYFFRILYIEVCQDCQSSSISISRITLVISLGRSYHSTKALDLWQLTSDQCKFGKNLKCYYLFSINYRIVSFKSWFFYSLEPLFDRFILLKILTAGVSYHNHIKLKSPSSPSIY